MRLDDTLHIERHIGFTPYDHHRHQTNIPMNSTSVTEVRPPSSSLLPPPIPVLQLELGPRVIQEEPTAKYDAYNAPRFLHYLCSLCSRKRCQECHFPCSNPSPTTLYREDVHLHRGQIQCIHIVPDVCRGLPPKVLLCHLSQFQ